MISWRGRSNVQSFDINQITSHEWVCFFLFFLAEIKLFFLINPINTAYQCKLFFCFFLIFIHIFYSSDFSFTFTQPDFHLMTLPTVIYVTILIWDKFDLLICVVDMVSAVYTQRWWFLFCFYIFCSIAFILSCKHNRFCFIRKKLYPYWQ